MSLRAKLRVLSGATFVVLAAALPMVVLTVCQPRVDVTPLEVPLAGDFVAGDLAIHTEEAAILSVQERAIWVRALGLAPRIEVRWRGSGFYARPIEVHLENVNLRVGEVLLSPQAHEVSRLGATVVVEAPLQSEPFTLGVRVPPAVLARGRFAAMGCTRSNTLMTPILDELERDPPLFLLHLGDISHGLAYELEAIRARFDRLGLPLFVSPGNHDVSTLFEYSLENFHRSLNPAPMSFGVEGARFALLDVSDYPISAAQLAWLENERAAAGDHRLWVCLHRSPFDPKSLGREIPAADGGAALAAILSRTKDASTLGSHLHGYGTGTFGGHPIVMTSGGGEDQGTPYHYLTVPLGGEDATFVPLEAPSLVASLRSRLTLEVPVFFGRPWAAIPGGGAALLVVAFFARRRRAKLAVVEAVTAVGPPTQGRGA